MSAAQPRRRKEQPAEQRAPLFEVREDPLPPRPMPLDTTRDPFEDLPDAGPRAPRPLAPATLPRTERPAPTLIPADDPDLPAAPAGDSIVRRSADLQQADMLRDSLIARRPIYGMAEPGGSPPGLFGGRTWLVVLIGLVCAVVVWFALAPSKTTFSGYPGDRSATKSSNPLTRILAPGNVPAGEHTVLGAPTITAALIDKVLEQYSSPARGTGKVWIAIGKQYGIDPAYALAFFIHESSAGTNPGWAGLKPGGGSTHNIGNIICAGYATCFGRFRDYASWDEGIEDWYKLISDEYVGGRGAQTVEQIIPVYAPASDNNDVPNYIQTVVSLVDSWRQGVIR